MYLYVRESLKSPWLHIGCSNIFFLMASKIPVAELMWYWIFIVCPMTSPCSDHLLINGSLSHAEYPDGLRSCLLISDTFAAMMAVMVAGQGQVKDLSFFSTSGRFFQITFYLSSLSRILHGKGIDIRGALGFFFFLQKKMDSFVNYLE